MECNNVPFQKIVFVCLNERESGVCCANHDAENIHARLKAAIKQRGWDTLVRVSRAGCMNRCMLGPNVMVFPDNRWYSGVTDEDIATILDDITKGVVVP